MNLLNEYVRLESFHLLSSTVLSAKIEMAGNNTTMSKLVVPGNLQICIHIQYVFCIQLFGATNKLFLSVLKNDCLIIKLHCELRNLDKLFT